jgi:hypothetical protein
MSQPSETDFRALIACCFQSSDATRPISQYAGRLLFGDPVGPLLREIKKRRQYELSAAGRIATMQQGGRNVR